MLSSPFREFLDYLAKFRFGEDKWLLLQTPQLFTQYWNLAGQINQIRVRIDQEANLYATPVIIVDPDKAIPQNAFFNPSTGKYEAARPVTWWVDVGVVAGLNTIYTPSAGKKFRLLGCILRAGAGIAIDLKDGAATFLSHVNAAGDSIQYPLTGNGYLSTAANNLLQAVAGVGGGNVVAYGCEE